MVFIVFVAIIAVTAAAPDISAKKSIIDNDANKKNLRSLCDSPACSQAASTILSKMDVNVNPCNNFYQFACGKFIEQTIIPDKESEVSFFIQTTKKLKELMFLSISEKIKDDDLPIFKSMKSFYQSCMDIEKIKANIGTELKEVLVNLGGWPILTGMTWDETGFDWKKLVSQSSKMGYEINFFINLDVYAYTTDRNQIQIQYPFPTGLSNDTSDPDVISYLKYMTDVANILGADVEMTKNDLMNLLEFELKLENIYKSGDETSEITVKEMHTINSRIPWIEYFNDILTPHALVDENEKVIVWNPSSVKTLFEFIEQTPKRVLANYGMWRIIRQSIEGPIEGHLANAAAEYTSSKMVQVPRRQTCFKLVNKYFPEAVKGLFIRHYLDKNAKTNVNSLVENVRASLHDIIEQVDWMDSVTKIRALEKLDSMHEDIGYQAELMDDEKLSEYYRNLEIHPESFLKFLNSLNRFHTEQRFSKLGKITSVPLSYDPSTINAYYNNKKNEITVPMGVLKGLFNDNRPNYMNYGEIGWFIGHEMAHAFDTHAHNDEGSQDDNKGNTDVWTTETKEKYLEKVNCIVEQYGNYTIEEINMPVNGTKTQSENLADNGGLKAAYFAYDKWAKANGPEPQLPGLDYIPRQMFWISAASVWCQKIRPQRLRYRNKIDKHAPVKFRIIGTMSSMPEFSKDFNCSPESSMNSKKKCNVW